MKLVYSSGFFFITLPKQQRVANRGRKIHVDEEDKKKKVHVEFPLFSIITAFMVCAAGEYYPLSS